METGRGARVNTSDEQDSSEEADDERDPDYNEKASSNENNEDEGGRIALSISGDDEIILDKKKDGQAAYQWSKTQLGHLKTNSLKEAV